MRATLVCLPALAALLTGGDAVGAQEGYDLEASRRLVRDAVEARTAGDTAAFLARLDSAVAVRPDHAGLIYPLAAELAERHRGRAVELLERLAGWGYAADPSKDERFSALAEDLRFREAAARLAGNARPAGSAVASAAVAVRLDDPLTLPEGLVLDPADGSLLLASVHRRSILRVDRPADGEPRVRVLVDGALDGLGAPLGMVVDPGRRALWVSSVRLPESRTAGAEAADGVVREYDLDTGRLRSEWAMPPSFSAGSPGDLALDGTGGVLVSDWKSGALLRARPGAAVLEEVLSSGSLASPQGLVVDVDGRGAWVADWAMGLVRVDLESGTATRVAAPGTSLIGSDALLAHEGGLIAVQNGFTPARVVRIDLSDDGRSVRRVTTLLAAHESFDEPTGATVVGDTLLLVANGQWAGFAEGATPDPEALTPPVILSISLAR